MGIASVTESGEEVHPADEPAELDLAQPPIGSRSMDWTRENREIEGRQDSLSAREHTPGARFDSQRDPDTLDGPESLSRRVPLLGRTRCCR
jgi:hypothetical protein